MDKYSINRWNYSDTLPDTGILIIRHGPRVGSDIPLADAYLTEDGRVRCRKFGMMWNGRPPSMILVSPIPRCKETGKIIMDSAGWNIDIKDEPLLGDPGPFVIDTEQANFKLSLKLR